MPLYVVQKVKKSSDSKGLAGFEGIGMTALFALFAVRKNAIPQK